jgi:hypothetical protein
MSCSFAEAPTATASIHIPDDLLARLDRLAADRGVSRNRLIVESVRDVVERHRERWPPGYLEGTHLDAGDRRILAEGAEEFVQGVLQARATRSV